MQIGVASMNLDFGRICQQLPIATFARSLIVQTGRLDLSACSEKPTCSPSQLKKGGALIGRNDNRSWHARQNVSAVG